MHESIRTLLSSFFGAICLLTWTWIDMYFELGSFFSPDDSGDGYSGLFNMFLILVFVLFWAYGFLVQAWYFLPLYERLKKDKHHELWGGVVPCILIGAITSIIMVIIFRPESDYLFGMIISSWWTSFVYFLSAHIAFFYLSRKFNQ